MITVNAEHERVLYLGKVGENSAVEVVFSTRGWREMYGDGQAFLWVIAPGSTTPYPAVIEQTEDAVKWVVFASDLEKSGKGKVELQWRVGEKVVKSCHYPTYIADSLTGSDTTAPPESTWVDKVVAAGKKAESANTEAQEAAARAEDAAKRAEAATGTMEIGDGLKWGGKDNRTLMVDATNDVQRDNSKPITSAGVYVTVGNIEALLAAL